MTQKLVLSMDALHDFRVFLSSSSLLLLLLLLLICKLSNPLASFLWQKFMQFSTYKHAPSPSYFKCVYVISYFTLRPHLSFTIAFFLFFFFFFFWIKIGQLFKSFDKDRMEGIEATNYKVLQLKHLIIFGQN